MSEAAISRIFERLDDISERLSLLEGMFKEHSKVGECGATHSDKKWLQWLVGALIGIIGTMVGVATR